MAEAPAVYSSESMRAEKRAVAGSSVLAAIAITVLKTVVGIFCRFAFLTSPPTPSTNTDTVR
jgi:hypothetical protein